MHGSDMPIPIITSTQDTNLIQALNATIDYKTKPLGSLGQLEAIAKQIGLIQQTTQPVLCNPGIFVFAADHGITAENISAYPQSVTWQMVENFLAQGAAINVFARQNNCALHIVDAGVNHDFGNRPGLIHRKVKWGTRNFVQEPAMTMAECNQAMEAGMRLVQEFDGNVLGFGEMGIGNTTAAAAIMHKVTGLAVADCVGAGTGLSAEGVRHKQHVIEQAVQRYASVSSPMDILATFGGFEIAMISGAMLQAAHQRKILLIDGFIVTSALLVAAQLQPEILDYCLFAHCSDEQGHRQMLEYMKARPLLQLGLRLGEGTGCALALPLLHAAVNFMNEMATFASASVSEKLE
jgi:nicotinate-nucleotide--dimethylbenzimidazole phosphoribosyltransferase